LVIQGEKLDCLGGQGREEVPTEWLGRWVFLAAIIAGALLIHGCLSS